MRLNKPIPRLTECKSEMMDSTLKFWGLTSNIYSWGKIFEYRSDVHFLKYYMVLIWFERVVQYTIFFGIAFMYNGTGNAEYLCCTVLKTGWNRHYDISNRNQFRILYFIHHKLIYLSMHTPTELQNLIFTSCLWNIIDCAPVKDRLAKCRSHKSGNIKTR
jgi:hypothetical protein